MLEFRVRCRGNNGVSPKRLGLEAASYVWDIGLMKLVQGRREKYGFR